MPIASGSKNIDTTASRGNIDTVKKYRLARTPANSTKRFRVHPLTFLVLSSRQTTEAPRAPHARVQVIPRSRPFPGGFPGDWIPRVQKRG